MKCLICNEKTKGYICSDCYEKLSDGKVILIERGFLSPKRVLFLSKDKYTGKEVVKPLTPIVVSKKVFKKYLSLTEMLYV